MKFGRLEINPAKNPAILDTATWDPKTAWNIVKSIDQTYWQSMHEAIIGERALFANEHCIPYTSSCARYGASAFFLARLADSQQVFLEVGSPMLRSSCDGGLCDKEFLLGEPIGTIPLGEAGHITAYNTDAAVIDRYIRFLKPDKGQKALGATPRLGIGTRMSTAVWPGIWRAMEEGNFSTNAIQNSVRELNILEDILDGRSPRTNYLFGFGPVEEGHTGSTFEGLLVAGILDALKTDSHFEFGADADHIMVKRGPEGKEIAKRVIDAARYYSFFTLDVSDILDYDATTVSSNSTAESFLTEIIRHSNQRKAVLTYHSEQRNFAGQVYELDKAAIGRLIGKYWSALNAVEDLYSYIKTLKNETPFDLELSIDENPPDIRTDDCLTTEIELMFLILEMQRRDIPLTHIAPNFGIEKGVDYRGRDGLIGLEERIRKLYHIAGEGEIMLDCHSGDDLKCAVRKVVGRATGGEIHFKISPALQVIFAEALNDFDPQLFRFWWDDTMNYARREAAAGSVFATECLRQYETGADPTPSPRHAVFHHYNFASVGRRNSNGQFIHREKFYDLPLDFYRDYQDRVKLYLLEVANDVFNRNS
ncbi:MAG: tagaturonate epimerase family protein [Planctomycetota bacterium]|jgi:hypothetical protein